MSQQLSLFETVGDGDLVSPTKDLGDTKRQAIQRFLDRAKPGTIACVKQYKPNGRKTEYFRLDYRLGKKVKSIHIPGGNVRAKLAQYRARELQKLIDRGAELEEILAAVETYRGRS